MQESMAFEQKCIGGCSDLLKYLVPVRGLESLLEMVESRESFSSSFLHPKEEDNIGQEGR